LDRKSLILQKYKAEKKFQNNQVRFALHCSYFIGNMDACKLDACSKWFGGICHKKTEQIVKK
jgi:hypothetical protein